MTTSGFGCLAGLWKTWFVQTSEDDVMHNPCASPKIHLWMLGRCR